MTQAEFIEKSGLSSRMVKGIVKRLGGGTYAPDYFSDISNHGAAGGFSGFIYYRETVAFFNLYKKEIMAMIKNMADDLGEGILEMIQGFNCLTSTHAKNGWDSPGNLKNPDLCRRVPDYSTDEIAEAIYRGTGDGAGIIKNALAWFALEEVANSYVNLSGE